MEASPLLPLLLAAILFDLPADAFPAGGLSKHFSSIAEWTARTYPKSSAAAEESVLQFENGYVVETVVDGSSKLGVKPHSIRVSADGELLAVDCINNNIVRITPPLSQYSGARLVAGSFRGQSGHVDGKPSDARFSRPRGVAVDHSGNLFVADTANLAIRKIGESGVTTIAGGKSRTAGYRDGPSEDAMFSSDFDVVYLASRCALLVVDRGNAAIRQIALHPEDCDQKSSSISASDIVMVIGAVLVGYVFCILQHGLRSPPKQKEKQQPSGDRFEKKMSSPVVEKLEEDPVASWPSLTQLLFDLLKFSAESLSSAFLCLIPLNPSKEKLVTPEEGPQELPQKPLSNAKYRKRAELGEVSGAGQDQFLSVKHRKRPDMAEFYGPGDIPSSGSNKLQKERPRHRPVDGPDSSKMTSSRYRG